MKVHVEETELPGVLVIRPQVHVDGRGYFVELFRSDVWRDAGLPSDFVQINQSGSRRGVVRGLHFQWSPPQGKLMRVARGRAFLVAADVRRGSPTLGQWHGIELDDDSRTHVWAPAGFARGFCALAEPTEIQYLCTATYRAEGEGGVCWDDPDIGVEWPVDDPILSERDRSAPTLSAWLDSSAADHLAHPSG